ncbi:MAG: LysM peptidoglycan-binding domain-containing protein [Anaerolineae bacterium]
MSQKRLISGALALSSLLFLLAIATPSVRSQEGTGDQVEPVTQPPPVDWATIVMPPHEAIESESSARAAVAVPDGDQEEMEPADSTLSAAAAVPTRYVVQWGDSLYKISRRFSVSVSALTAANGIVNAHLIFPGQELTIPGSTAAPLTAGQPGGNSASTYVVRPGDTLSRIARRFGLSPQALAAANALSNPNFIRVGQVLRLAAAPPSSAAPSPPPAQEAPDSVGATTYIVRPGDSLHGIARRFGATAQALAAANHLANPNFLRVGQVLVIPETAVILPPSSSGKGMFIWPEDGRQIVKYFHTGHGAIDIVVSTGTPIVAAAAGTVEFAGWNAYGYGNLVVLDHGNGVRTLYAHNSSLKVRTGQRVAQGELISLSGNTGRSTMPHLHFEITLNLQTVNPCLYLPGGC